MAINTDLLIAAPMLQDYLVNKDTGLPLTGGLVSLYKDNARSFYKNWYYQTGSPGTYTWVALDNPLTLSVSGTIQDPNGNDVIPYYYPYSEDDETIAEPYYVTVYDADAMGNPTILQFTRENFPFNPSQTNPATVNPVWRNYILNNVFWRNLGSLDAMTVTDQVICPSQHDGYTNGDIRFIKDITGANDDLIFTPMTQALPGAGTPNGAITPEYMLNFKCAGVQLGEGVKCIQYPVSLHVKTLNSVQGTIIFYGNAAAGSSNNYVDLYFYQYTGSGALAAPVLSLIQRVTLGTTMQKYLVPFTTPLTDSLTSANLGKGQDDALFVRVQYPLSSLCEINHTKMQIYFSTDAPDNDFDTYDQIEGIINSPRTGDVKISLSGPIFSGTYQLFGYVPMNDGTIGNASSNATCRANADTWPLYKLIWESFAFASVTTTNNLAQLYDSAGVASAYGADAITDFNANKAISLTKQLGRTLLGTVPTHSSTTQTVQSQFTASDDGSGNLLLTLSAPNLTLYKGMPIVFSNNGGTYPGNINNGLFYASNILSTTTLNISTTYANALAGTIVAYSSAGTGTQLMNSSVLGGRTGEYAHTQLTAELAAHSHTIEPHNITLDGASANTFGKGGGGTPDTIIMGTTGSSTPFNVVQPSTYMNMFIKL